MSDVELVEETCVEVFTCVVVKFSEQEFRTVWIRLLDWASNPSSPKPRLITFYHLADK